MGKKENKTRRLNLWLTESEYSRLSKNANTVDKSISRCVRNAINNWNSEIEAFQERLVDVSLEEVNYG